MPAPQAVRLTDILADIADGDNDTTYNAGVGIVSTVPTLHSNATMPRSIA
ncbi:MAG: hypothetical protein R3B67_04360 [Phycisphaerales bacterium]